MHLSAVIFVFISILALADAAGIAATPYRLKKRQTCRRRTQSTLTNPNGRSGVAPWNNNTANTRVVTSPSVQQPDLVQPVVPAISSTAVNPSARIGGTSPIGTLKASFTIYGTGDFGGSSSCTANPNACGSHASGLTVALSQNFFGVGASQGGSSACGTCWKLTTDAGNSEIVTVDNECPALGNPICAMPSQTDTNSHGAVIHFDLCIDSGASKLLAGAGLGTGTAVRVNCGAGTVETY